MGIAEMAIDTLQKFNQPVPQPPVQQQYSRFDMDLGDDELVDGRKVKQILQNFANQPPPIDYGARQLAAQSLLQSIRMERSNEFKRWGPEIFSEINKLPMEYWTVDNLSTIINIVKSRHIDELAAEQAKRLVNESHPTIRSGSGGSDGVPLTNTSVLESGPRDMLDRLRSVGIASETQLREACKGTGISPSEYLTELEKYGKSGVVRG